MKNGWVIECPHCHTKIDEFSLADEWTCDVCGASGELTYGDDQDESER
jgi:hypothetical protein